MGKIKSAIITAFLVAAIIVLALFATISCNVPGTNGVKRYNSFISNIRLGGSLTGEAYALLYPEGVISSADYELVVNDKENQNRDDYMGGYTSHNGLYVKNDKYGPEFAESVDKDARIIADRFGKKGYTVTVEDDYSIRVSVPTNFNYASFSGKDATARSAALSEISHTVQYLMLDGGLSLRDGTEYDSSKSLLSIREDISTYFKSISFYSMAGQYAVRMNLTNEGFEKLNALITAGESGGTAYFYIGETNLNLTMSLGSDKALTEKTMLYSADKSYAEDFSILLKSVVDGNKLANSYNDDGANTGTNIITLTPSYGEYAAIHLLVVMLLVITGAIAGSVIKYKKLGLVNAIMVLIYALVIVTATMLIGIQLTIAGAFVAALGLALMCFTNFRVFEAVRAETATGRTIQASVKLGYKKTLFTVLDLHVILLVAALMITLIGVGEVSACGFIFFIATICSYVLYWFTRLMWFVISSPVKDKFKFCGYKREVLEDED